MKTTTTQAGVTYSTIGRDARGRFSDLPVIMVQTPRGHWYRSDDPKDPRHNDTLCRGCGARGHFNHILDRTTCTVPAGDADIRAALGIGPTPVFCVFVASAPEPATFAAPAAALAYADEMVARGHRVFTDA
jgi:hypothetical protein